MSGIIISGTMFQTSTTEFYDLVFNFEDYLERGETLKEYTLFVNNEQIVFDFATRYENFLAGSGTYSSVMILDSELYDHSTVLVTLSTGVLGSGYNIQVSAKTNRHTELNKFIDVFVDNSTPDSYYNFDYRLLIDKNTLYILPTVRDIYNDIPFGYNNEFIINIHKELPDIIGRELCESTSFTFTSKYCPMFTSYTKIAMMIGPEIEKIPKDTINRYIHNNSKEALSFMNMGTNCNSPKYEYDAFGCTYENVPYNLTRYVECKTAYDIIQLVNRLRYINGMAQGQSKSLGDLSIKYDSYKPVSSNDNINRTKDYYNCWTSLQNILSNTPNACGVGGGIANAVRGKYDISKGYPHPTLDVNHNRVIKPKPNADGPWFNTTNWRYPHTFRSVPPYTQE